MARQRNPEPHVVRDHDDDPQPLPDRPCQVRHGKELFVAVVVFYPTNLLVGCRVG